MAAGPGVLVSSEDFVSDRAFSCSSSLQFYQKRRGTLNRLGFSNAQMLCFRLPLWQPRSSSPRLTLPPPLQSPSLPSSLTRHPRSLRQLSRTARPTGSPTSRRCPPPLPKPPPPPPLSHARNLSARHCGPTLRGRRRLFIVECFSMSRRQAKAGGPTDTGVNLIVHAMEAGCVGRRI